MISPAKINFGLKILSKRKDGYHNIESFFLKLNWGDQIEFYPNQTNKIQLFSKNELEFPQKKLFEEVSERGNFSNNILFKAYELAKELEYEIPGVDIYLTKKIPPGGGLGGGSSNAASLLKYLFYNTKYDLSNELRNLATRLGADVLFFLEEGHAHVTGIGDRIRPIEVGKSIGLLIVPPVAISTKQAYSSLKKPLQEDLHEKTWNLLDEEIAFQLENANWSFFRNKFENDFEVYAFELYPYLKALKSELYDHQSLFVSMTGSGSCFYALFENLDTLLESKSFIETKYSDHHCFQFSF